MVFIWEMDLLSFNDAITLPLFNRRGTLQASGLGGPGAARSTDGTPREHVALGLV